MSSSSSIRNSRKPSDMARLLGGGGPPTTRSASSLPHPTRGVDSRPSFAGDLDRDASTPPDLRTDGKGPAPAGHHLLDDEQARVVPARDGIEQGAGLDLAQAGPFVMDGKGHSS